MAKMTEAQDRAADKKAGIKPGSARDKALDRKRGLKPMKSKSTMAKQPPRGGY